MTVTVRRYGGMFAMKPQVRTFSEADLDVPAREALTELLNHEPVAPSTPMPDAFTYAFEVEPTPGSKKSVKVPGHSVPAALRKLLP